MVCNECELRGDITIGSMTVIHPRASIIAEAGPIIIGDCNIVEEQACIINRLESGIFYLEFQICVVSSNLFTVH
jgi:dynactin-6